MEKSRKMILISLVILFISQFSNYVNEVAIPDFNTGSIVQSGGTYIASRTGWETHTWYSGIVMVLFALYFMDRPRSRKAYFICLPVIIILGLGGGAGGSQGAIAIILAIYSVWLKSKELKKA